MSYPNIIYGDYGDEKVQSSIKVLPFGQLMILPDGRQFRYAKAATAISAGRLLQQLAITGSDIEQSMAVASGGAAGSTSVTITLGDTTAMTKDLMAEGFLLVDAATGSGYIYKIKSNNSAASGASCAFTLYPEDPIITSLSAGTTTVGLRRNAFDNIKTWQSGTAAIGIVAGVAPRAVTINYYFWCQRVGECAVLADGTLVKGNFVTASTAADGAVAPKTAQSAGTGAFSDVVIGQVINLAASTETALIYLTLP